MGWKLFSSDLSRLGFPIRGWTIAMTVPFARLLFIIRETVGPTMPNISFKKYVGTMSRGQVVDFVS